MIELPEAVSVAGQLNNAFRGQKAMRVVAAHTPHKLAWYYGEPAGFSELLVGRTVGRAIGFGSMVEIKLENANILFSEGVAIRYHEADDPHPAKHQLLLEFDDRSALTASVRMYGGLGAFLEGELDNYYRQVAKEKPSPLTPGFDEAYFDRIINDDSVQKLSLKALLATEQRIPGLGNGVLQDILFNANLHPKRKVNTLSVEDRGRLYTAVRTTIASMAAGGGRDTELDLFGNPGGYKTILSKNTVGGPCRTCGTIIKKESYMGGSIYHCGQCQTL